MDANAQSDNLERSRPVKQRRLNDNERQRAVQACDGCRRVKEKCEGGVPCRRCKHFSRPCRFSKIAPKNNRRQNDSSPSDAGPNTYGQSGPSERGGARGRAHDGDIYERQRALEAIARHFLPTLGLDLASLQNAARDLTNRNPRLPTFRSASNSSEDDDPTTVEEQCSVEPVQDNVAHYSGEFSYWNFSQRVKQHVKDLETDNAVATSTEADNLSNYWRVEQLNSQQGIVSEAIKAFPPNSVADFLTRVFFTHACDSYFFVERKWLERKLRLAYQSPTKFGSEDSGTIAIILLVFAIGSQYAHLESSRNSNKETDSMSDWDQQLGMMFYQKAVQLLPDIIHLGSLESVQSTCLLALYMLPIDAAGLSWIYSNLSIKLAIQNGMHRKAPKGLANTPKAEVRNRVWWTVYCIEKKISVFHGRPNSISTTDIDVEMPAIVQELESADQPFDLDLLNQSISLIKRLEAIRGKIAAITKAADRKEVSAGLAELLNASKALLTWWQDSDLSTTARLSSVNRPALHVRLEFCLIRMFIGRPFIMANVRPSGTAETPDDLRDADSGSNVSLPTSSQSKSHRAAQKAILVQDCVEAAKEALEICKALQRSIEGLARASYLEYSSCRGALLVLIAYCISLKTNQHQQIIDTGLELISDMETTGESAKSEIMLIRTLEKSMRRLVQTHQSRLAPIAVPTAENGYEGFRNWRSSVQRLGPPHEMERLPSISQAMQPPSLPGQSSALTPGSSMAVSDPNMTSPLDYTTALWQNTPMGSFFDLDDFNFALDDQGFFYPNIS